MQCPFCGGNAIEIEETHSSIGTWRSTLCCGVDWQLVTNYDLLTKLPPEMIETALATDRLNRAKRVAKIEADAAAFKEWIEECDRRFPDFLKGGEQEATPFDIVALADRAH